MITTAIYADRVNSVIRKEYGPLKNAAKILARKIHSTPRTIENWLAGRNAPRGAELIRLMQECEALREEVFKLVEEGKCDSRSK